VEDGDDAAGARGSAGLGLRVGLRLSGRCPHVRCQRELAWSCEAPPDEMVFSDCEWNHEVWAGFFVDFAGLAEGLDEGHCGDDGVEGYCFIGDNWLVWR